MKDVLTKRKRVGEFYTISLTQKCSQLVQGKHPQKLKDPISFIIPCTIEYSFCGRVLFDLGGSINLIPLSFNKIGTGTIRHTTITQGKIEDMLVLVDKFVFPFISLSWTFRVCLVQKRGMGGERF